MTEKLTQEELEAIAEEVLQTILAKVEEALINEISHEKLSQAFIGGLSKWKLAHSIAETYRNGFKKFSDQLATEKSDIWTVKIIHNCIMDAVSTISHAYEAMRFSDSEGGFFGGLFSGTTEQRSLSNYKSFLEQSFFRITEAESHLKNAIELHSTEVEKEADEKKEAEKE